MWTRVLIFSAPKKMPHELEPRFTINKGLRGHRWMLSDETEASKAEDKPTRYPLEIIELELAVLGQL
jgi:hypothetical protein